MQRRHTGRARPTANQDDSDTEALLKSGAVLATTAPKSQATGDTGWSLNTAGVLHPALPGGFSENCAGHSNICGPCRAGLRDALKGIGGMLGGRFEGSDAELRQAPPAVPPLHHDKGEGIRRGRFNELWHPAIAGAGLPAGPRFHDPRHYYASLLIRHGESVKVVQTRLRHASASASETLDTYSHLWPDPGSHPAGHRQRVGSDGVCTGCAPAGAADA